VISTTASPLPAIDFADVLNQAPSLVRLDDFLREPDWKKALAYWVNQHPLPVKNATAVTLLIEQSISHIDQLINTQLNAIIHHRKFQRLEASWRGLYYLTVQAEGIKLAKIKMLDASWQEVTKDLSRALEFDQSSLYNKIYSEEYGTPGGEPYGVIIGDYEISHKQTSRHPFDDISALDSLAQIAAAAFSPFIAGVSCEFFGMDDFASLRLPLNLANLFAQEEYIQWRALRSKNEARFVGLTLPRTLMRKPYRTTPGSYRGLFFCEQIKSAEDYVWGNAAYAFGGVLLREFGSVGWFGHIRGVPRNHIGGGLVTNLPCDAFTTDPGDIIYKPSTDVVITDNIERDISNLGFIPLCQCFATPFLAFYSNQSIQLSKRLANKDAQVNAKLSSMLQHVLCASRVAHYIKVMVRDKIGSFISAQGCEDFLRRWLHQYTTGRKDMEWEEQARYPIQESNVRVREHPEKPGSYLCVIHLVPCYQADQMVTDLELVTELVQGAN
jgi:type VI secretion system protein ImpD